MNVDASEYIDKLCKKHFELQMILRLTGCELDVVVDLIVNTIRLIYRIEVGGCTLYSETVSS